MVKYVPNGLDNWAIRFLGERLQADLKMLYEFYNSAVSVSASH
jgi:hypothetical protein